MDFTFFFMATITLINTAYAGKFPVKDLLFVEEIGAYSVELSESKDLKFSYVVVTEDEWRTMTTSDFAQYKAIIINDPAPGYDPATLQFLVDTADVWGPAVKGNVIIHGADASNHYATNLIDNSIKFAASGKSSSGDRQTGLFISLTQYYDTDDISYVPALSYFGNFTVRGNLDCYDTVHIVATAPAIANLTDEYLSDWSCSVHEAFASYPTEGVEGFQALAIADGVTGLGTQNFANGKYGLPYIISRGATPSGCGDGHWDPSIGEECDDGNIKDFDGCSRSCKCESGLPTGNGTCFPSVDGLVRLPGTFYDGYYYSAVYLSVTVTVLFKTLWGIVVAATKMIEPFHQLHKEGGASAQESLLSDYLSSGFSLESIKNVFRGHHVMSLTTAVYLIATIAMIVASESTTIRSGNYCATPDQPLKCDLQWVIDVKVARALQALMALSAAMIVLRIFLSWHRTSGVSSYPCTIAAMATLLNNSNINDSFRDIDPDVNNKDLGKSLSEKQYALRRYETSPGNTRYGLIQISVPQKKKHWWQVGPLQSLPAMPAMPAIPGFSQSPAAPSSDEDAKPKPDRTKLKENLILGGFMTIHIVLFVIFLYYRLTNNPKLFVNEGRYGPRTLLTLTSVILGTYWSQLEAEVRVMTPYRRLAQPKVKSRHILNMSLHGVPIVTFFTALWHFNFFHAYIALIANLSTCLTIAIVGIPYNFGVIQTVSVFSSTACLGLLLLMIITCPAIFWWRRTNPAMPRKPDTLASIIMMLCASRMLGYFEGLDQDLNGRRELKERIYDQKFELKKLKGVDGKERVMVEAVDSGLEQDGITVKVEEVTPEREDVVYGHFQNEYEQPSNDIVEPSDKNAFSDHGPTRRNMF